MKKWLRILLSLNNLQKALGFQTFYKSVRQNHKLEILDSINIKKVLVLAPHPDDDIFGCGGMIRQIADNNGEVTVVYFCDGAGGVKDETEKYDNKLIQIRRNEARQAGQVLKIKEQIFFGYRDGKLSSAQSAPKALSDLIERIEPDIILVPSFLDNHPDHLASNQILISALAKLYRSSLKPDFWQKLEIWAYEVWTPIFINRLVVINQQIEIKKQAMATQKSQLEARNYDQAILGLNTYRAQVNGQDGYAEGFFVTSPAIYQKFFEKV